MSIFIDAAVLIFLCTLYAVIHSLLASEKIKKIVSKKTGKLFAFYRFFYVVTSILFLYFLIDFAPTLDNVIFDLKYPFDIIMIGIQLLTIIGFYWSARYVCIKEFLGLAQIARFFSGSFSENDHSLFCYRGPYKFTRHPFNFFIIIYLLARPFMDLQYLILCVCAVIYFYIGSYYEEKKLINKFGNDYLDYMSKVPKIIPYKIFRGNIE